MHIHAVIVSTVTAHSQVGLLHADYPLTMPQQRDLMTSQDRLAWAVQQLELRGLSLAAVGDAIGCTHVTLSHWKNSKTTVENIKVGLLSAFCEHTGVSLHWILTGDGERFERYFSSELVAGLVNKLVALEREAPATLSVVARMVDAAVVKPEQS
jgi:transcriptional regulator with XRE-family HTH domain